MASSTNVVLENKDLPRSADNIEQGKKRILKTGDYYKIVNFINKYVGLPIDCEFELHKRFPDIDPKSLSSILNTEMRTKIKATHRKWNSNAKILIKQFDEEASKNPYNADIIIEISKEVGLPPSAVSRILLSEKFKTQNKNNITEFLRNPYTIEDPCLALNVQSAVCSDNLDGPVIDIIRRCIGEEYEIRLKDLAKQAGLYYLDEAVLRRTGFDKTPDLKLAIPCLYKGLEVNWIESKALFGDVKTHRSYISQQIASYSNRFGSGIIIYWFGFQIDVLKVEENMNGLIILDHFPEKEHIELLKIN